MHFVYDVGSYRVMLVHDLCSNIVDKYVLNFGMTHINEFSYPATAPLDVTQEEWLFQHMGIERGDTYWLFSETSARPTRYQVKGITLVADESLPNFGIILTSIPTFRPLPEPVGIALPDGVSLATATGWKPVDDCTIFEQAIENVLQPNRLSARHIDAFVLATGIMRFVICEINATSSNKDDQEQEHVLLTAFVQSGDELIVLEFESISGTLMPFVFLHEDVERDGVAYRGKWTVLPAVGKIAYPLICIVSETQSSVYALCDFGLSEMTQDGFRGVWRMQVEVRRGP